MGKKDRKRKQRRAAEAERKKDEVDSEDDEGDKVENITEGTRMVSLEKEEIGETKSAQRLHGTQGTPETPAISHQEERVVPETPAMSHQEERVVPETTTGPAPEEGGAWAVAGKERRKETAPPSGRGAGKSRGAVAEAKGRGRGRGRGQVQQELRTPGKSQHPVSNVGPGHQPGHEFPYSKPKQDTTNSTQRAIRPEGPNTPGAQRVHPATGSDPTRVTSDSDRVAQPGQPRDVRPKVHPAPTGGPKSVPVLDAPTGEAGQVREVPSSTSAMAVPPDVRPKTTTAPRVAQPGQPRDVRPKVRPAPTGGPKSVPVLDAPTGEAGQVREIPSSTSAMGIPPDVRPKTTTAPPPSNQAAVDPRQRPLPDSSQAAGPSVGRPGEVSVDKLGFPTPAPGAPSIPPGVGDVRYEYRPITRPGNNRGYGTLGRLIRLRANHFDIEMKLEGTLLQYHVEITPEGKQLRTCLPKGLARQIINTLVDKYRDIFRRGSPPVYDGRSNLYSSQPLPLRSQEPTELKVTLPKDDKLETFIVRLKGPVNQIDLSTLGQFLENYQGDVPVDAINVLDIILRHLPSMRYATFGQSFYLPPQNYSVGEDSHLGGGRELWFGYHQSVRISGWKKLTLNFDITATAFYEPMNCVNFVYEALELRGNITRPLNDWQWEKLAKEIKGMKLETNYAGKKKRKAVGLSPRPARMQSFPIEDTSGRQREITVENYFKKTYDITLRHPMLPCVQFGKVDGHNFIPMELCYVLQQKVDKKLTDRQQTIMIRKMAMPADIRAEHIQKLMKHAEFENNEYLDQFGMSINSRMRQIEGRVLEPPPILYKNNNTSKPARGVWDSRGLAYFDGVKIEKWAVVCLPGFEGWDGVTNEKLDQFIKALMNAASSAGMMMPRPWRQDRVRPERLETHLEDLCQEGDLQIILVVLSGEKDIYERVKQIGDVRQGVITQCVKASSVNRHNPVLVANICHKINAKLGGTNNVLDKRTDRIVRPRIFNKPFMVFGADVTHPASHNTTHPSIAAVVGSLDANCIKYATIVRTQPHRKEIIADLSNIMKTLLINFFRHTKAKPEKIIFFRDGVGEGQFNQVLNVELRAMRQACLEIQKDGGYKPAITFIVVQKRHHTRLFCDNTKDWEGKAHNVPAGTCVDKGITSPKDFDYYLCSHTGIQGTSKPTHYNILWDDNNLSADELQLLTFQLCHAYVNCTRSVSIPAPVYYAHKAAFRARAHLGEDGAGGCDQNGQPTREMHEAVKCHGKLESSMYFI